MHRTTLATNGVELKRLLASFWLLCLLALPSSMSQEEVPPPVEAEAIVEESFAVVKWVPPPLPPEEMGRATYRIYGYSNGTFTLLDAQHEIGYTAIVEGGHETYAVSLYIADGRESQYKLACISFHIGPPPAVRKYC